MKNKFFYALLALAIPIIVYAQVTQRPLSNKGLSEGITYFVLGTANSDFSPAPSNGELAIRNNPGATPELVFWDSSVGDWVATGSVVVAAGSGTVNTVAKFNAAGELEDTDIVESFGNFLYNGGSFRGQGTGISSLQGNIGVTLDAGAGAPGPADIFLSADDNITLTSLDDMFFVSDFFDVDASMDIFLASDTVAALSTGDFGAQIQANESGGNAEIFLSVTEVGSGISLSAVTAGGTITMASDDGVRMPITTQAVLGTPVDGSVFYCTDCNPDATCTGAGAGAFAFRINGAWACELN